MSGETRVEPIVKEPYEPPSIEVIVLSSAEALLGVCFVIFEGGQGCSMALSDSGGT